MLKCPFFHLSFAFIITVTALASCYILERRRKKKNIFCQIPVFCLEAVSVHALPCPYNSVFEKLKNARTFQQNVVAMLKIQFFCLQQALQKTTLDLSRSQTYALGKWDAQGSSLSTSEGYWVFPSEIKKKKK